MNHVKRMAALVLALLLLVPSVGCQNKKKAYDEAQRLLVSGARMEAAAAFAALGEYEDAANRILECHYREAEFLLEQGRYPEAVEEFTLAGEYEDAARQASLYKTTFDTAAFAERFKKLYKENNESMAFDQVAENGYVLSYNGWGFGTLGFESYDESGAKVEGMKAPNTAFIMIREDKPVSESTEVEFESFVTIFGTMASLAICARDEAVDPDVAAKTLAESVLRVITNPSEADHFTINDLEYATSIIVYPESYCMMLVMQ